MNSPQTLSCAALLLLEQDGGPAGAGQLRRQRRPGHASPDNRGVVRLHAAAFTRETQSRKGVQDSIAGRAVRAARPPSTERTQSRFLKAAAMDTGPSWRMKRCRRVAQKANFRK